MIIFSLVEAVAKVSYIDGCAMMTRRNLRRICAITLRGHTRHTHLYLFVQQGFKPLMCVIRVLYAFADSMIKRVHERKISVL